MQAYARWMFTNITNKPLWLVSAYLRRPRVDGNVLVRHHVQNVYGHPPLMPGLAQPGSTDFWIQPPTRRPGQNLKASVVFVDNLGNEHVRNVTFLGPKRK